MTDKKWRWGEPLDKISADALASKWADGAIISEVERWRRFRDAIFDYIDKLDQKTRYHTLGQVRNWMAEHNVLEEEVDIDDNLLQHTICEAQCAQEHKDKTGEDLDNAYWGCMFQCSPIQGSEAFTVDPLDPHRPPPSDIDPEKLGLVTYSIGKIILPEHLRRN